MYGRDNANILIHRLGLYVKIGDWVPAAFMKILENALEHASSAPGDPTDGIVCGKAYPVMTEQT